MAILINQRDLLYQRNALDVAAKTLIIFDSWT